MGIEQIWTHLREHGLAAQQRISETHPCDIYADFEPPHGIGLVAICGNRPILPREVMKAVSVESGQRDDARWSLRLQLHSVQLTPVFAALCDDIIRATSSGVGPNQLAAAVLARLHHWRSLLEQSGGGLEPSVLRGLIGELTVLRAKLLSSLPAREAIEAWRGPLGAPQDFMLPDGSRIEVKTVERDTATVRISGLEQLDSGVDALILAVVRVQRTAPSAIGAQTAPQGIALVRAAMQSDTEALRLFDERLAALNWHEDVSHHQLAVRVLDVHAYAVSGRFPRLTTGDVPPGVERAEYDIRLPGEGYDTWTLPDD